MNYNKKTIFATLFALIVVVATILLFSSMGAKARTINVDDDGGKDYTKIQDAINASSDGDMIYVYNGTYNESITINKTITLIGESNQNTVIQGTGALNFKGIYVTASGVSISNLKIDKFYWGWGIYLYYSSNNNITSNTIANSSNYGIYLESGSYNNINSNTVSNCTSAGIFLSSSNNNIASNTISNCNNGIYLYSRAYNNINSNTVSNCNNGIYLYSSSYNNINSNTVSNCYNYGIYLYDSNNNNITSNTVTNCSNLGFYLFKNSNYNNITFNTITNCSNIGICLGGSSNTITSNTLTNSGMFVLGDNTVSGNTINGKPVLYYKNIDARTSPQTLDNVNANGIILYNCQGFVIKNTITECGGILVGMSSQIDIIHNTLMNCSVGLILYTSSNNNVTSNTLVNCKYGIDVEGSNNNNITSNNIYGNKQYGLYQYSSTGNTAYNNWWGNITGPHNNNSNPNGTGDNITDDIPFIPWATEPFNISISIINHPPTILPIPTQNITVNTTFSYQINAIDVDNDTLNYNASLGNITDTVQFTFTPTSPGTYNITITVNDTKSETNIMFTLIVNATPIVPVNHPPSISPISIQNVTVNTTFSYQIQAADIDGDNLAYKTSIGTINATGFFTFTSTTPGAYNITITVNDTKTQTETSFILIVNTTHIQPINHAPTITSVTANRTTVNISEQITISVIASDVDSDNLIYSYSATGGVISGNCTTATWIAPNNAGNYTITVTASDGNLTVTGTITIAVVNNTPIAEKPREQKKEFIPFAGVGVITICVLLLAALVELMKRKSHNP